MVPPGASRWFASGYLVQADPIDWTKQTVTRFRGHLQRVCEPSPPGEGKKRANGKVKSGPAFEVSPKSDDELPDGATAAEAVKRIGELKAKGGPFFLAVGFVKPHLPFVAPKKYWDLHDPAAIPGPAIETLPAGTDPFVGHTNGELHSYVGVPEGNPVPDEFARSLRHGYSLCQLHRRPGRSIARRARGERTRGEHRRGTLGRPRLAAG
ncbi:MAG: hypothetical protein R3F31_01955 [Verrucomicrobiales bacterium]